MAKRKKEKDISGKRQIAKHYVKECGRVWGEMKDITNMEQCEAHPAVGDGRKADGNRFWG